VALVVGPNRLAVGQARAVQTRFSLGGNTLSSIDALSGKVSLMKSTRGRRLAALLVVFVALAAVAVAAFAIGANNSSGLFGRGIEMRGYGMGMRYGAGFGLFGLLGFILVGLLVFWLIAAIVSPDGRSRGPVGTAPGAPAAGDFDRLRELSEMHTRGELTDEEFTAAKRKILGLE
jgi:uncharacterized membrane protein